jgi:LPXTG-motif cell wall-anchored protein
VKSGKSLRRLLSAAAAIVVGGIASIGLIAPAPAAAASLPDLQVSVVVTPTKATYAVGDAVTTTFVVKNAGTVAAKNARLEGGDEDGVTRTTDPPDQPFDLAPGATTSVPWTGTIDQAAFTQGFASGGFSFTNDAGEANPADNTGRFHILVPGGKGTLTGKVFIDLEGNFDSSQPGLAGAKVTITDGGGKVAGTATTDSTGHYTITNVPAGDYALAIADWKIEGEDGPTTNIQVMADQVSDTFIALVPGSHTTPSPTATATGGATTSSSGGVPALPVTGTRTGLIFAVGAGVLLLGAVAVIVGRRRRNRFVAPD